MDRDQWPLAGGNIYEFTWAGGQLAPLDRDREPIVIAGGQPADVEVTIRVFVSPSRALCGEVSVATLATTSRQQNNTLGPPREDPVHIDSALWRALPIGRMVEDTFTAVREHAQRIGRELGDEFLVEVGDAEPPPRRRGPRPSLTQELLAQVVAPAYRAGGRKPVEAVRAAMQKHKYPGSGPGGEVTINQARKAVTRARAAGLVAPTTRGATS